MQSIQELQKAAVKPFEYRHLGSFAYVGDNKAVLKMPIIGTYMHVTYIPYCLKLQPVLYKCQVLFSG